MRSVSRRPNRTRAAVIDGGSVAFPAVGPENLVRLAEESLQVYSTLLRLHPPYGDVVADREYISSISGLASRDATSPTGLSSAEAAASTETSHQVLFPRYIFPSLRPWWIDYIGSIGPPAFLFVASMVQTLYPRPAL